MKMAVFSGHLFEKDYLYKAASDQHEIIWIESRLNASTAIMANGCKAACIFVNDEASDTVLKSLKELGIQFLLCRSAGYNHVDLKAAANLEMKVARVPEYSPYAVAEHSVALMLALNRKIVKAHNRVRDGNFSLDGLTGFDMHEKTVGIVGFGKIGKALASIMHGFGCKILVHDPLPDKDWHKEIPVTFTDLDHLCKVSDIISLHAPLTAETKYMIGKERIEAMKNGVMLINTGRGGLLDTKAVIQGLKSGKIAYLGLDVYEGEKELFFEDRSDDILQDDTIARLMTFPNVLITSHQAFLTDTALKHIAEVTMGNLSDFELQRKCQNEVVS